MNNPHLDAFCEKIVQSLGNNEFVKLTLSNKRNKEYDLKHITAKAVLIKNNQKLRPLQNKARVNFLVFLLKIFSFISSKMFFYRFLLILLL